MSKRLLTLTAATLWGVVAQAADLEAGKAAAQLQCARCHAVSDWEGEDAASLESLIRDIVANKVKHNKGKVELSAAEMTNIAAYWGSGGRATGGKGKKSK